MKKIYLFILLALFYSFPGCNKDETTPVTTVVNPPPSSNSWSQVYEEKVWGTFYCNFPNSCWIDIVTDTLDLRNCDSVRVLMYYRSYYNGALTITKVPYPVELYSCVFPDSTTGMLDKYFGINYNAKVLFDFGFTVGNKFTIDTLKIYKK